MYNKTLHVHAVRLDTLEQSSTCTCTYMYIDMYIVYMNVHWCVYCVQTNTDIMTPLLKFTADTMEFLRNHLSQILVMWGMMCELVIAKQCVCTGLQLCEHRKVIKSVSVSLWLYMHLSLHPQMYTFCYQVSSKFCKVLIFIRLFYLDTSGELCNKQECDNRML